MGKTPSKSIADLVVMTGYVTNDNGLLFVSFTLNSAVGQNDNTWYLYFMPYTVTVHLIGFTDIALCRNFEDNIGHVHCDRHTTIWCSLSPV